MYGEVYEILGIHDFFFLQKVLVTKSHKGVELYSFHINNCQVIN